MLGGGNFATQNKVLSGSYINFISLANASATLSERGVATMPLVLDWGKEGEIFTVTKEDFQKNSLKIFGYSYTDDKLKSLRDLFLNVSTFYGYRLNSNGDVATCDLGSAKYSGVRGNDLTIVVEINADDESFFDVKTLLGTVEADSQRVAIYGDLVDNDYVKFDKVLGTLEETAGMVLTGGTNGEVDGTSHQNYLDKIEGYSYNVMGVDVTDDVTKALYTSFNRRMRDEVGAKFQLVLHRFNADYEGVISVENEVLDYNEANGENISSLVYWVVGAEASCEVNKSLLNKVYNGEFSVNTDYTQSQLIDLINNGKFAFHNVGDDVRVLSDINTLVNITLDKGDIFKENQTVRVCDQIANDIATLFNTKYLGIIPNDNAGRVSLWSDIVNHHKQLQSIRAIENFDSDNITVEQGDTKKAVVVTDLITIVNAMGQLYMTVKVE